jgi:adenylosuccinate synthase
MPISVVVGGQFGSEGKGKVAHALAIARNARAVVRVGGPNSGHTVVDPAGKRWIFRQLPTAAILDKPICVIAAGSYVDPTVLTGEIRSFRLKPDRLKIDPKAILIESTAKEDEKSMRLRERIGSTLTGTGVAVSQRVNRDPKINWVTAAPELIPYICDTGEYLSDAIAAGERIIAEGSQGFGLSVIHAPYFPYATSRDTTAAGVLSEIGLSPLVVDEIALVIRSYPIRVPGNSGPLPGEITWEEVTKRSGSVEPLEEFTSVTRARRRVAEFDPSIVKRAIRANAPTSIYLNHVDYVDAECRGTGRLTQRAVKFVTEVERTIGKEISHVGVCPSSVISRSAWRRMAVVA